MNTAEITLSSLTNYNVQEQRNNIIRRFLAERYSIKSGALANQLVQQFTAQVASQIKNSKAFATAVLNTLDESERNKEKYDSDVADKLDNAVMNEINTGSIVLDETGAIITQDEILNASTELALDDVAESPEFDINLANEFKVWLGHQPLTEITSALQSKSYDGLIERFNETLV